MSQHKDKWSIVVKRSNFIKTHDKRDVCGNSILLADAYEHLHYQWIGADEFFRRFTHLFGDVVNHENDSTINKAFRIGLGAYADVLQQRNRRYYPHERLKVFLAGCFFGATDVCKYVVIDSVKKEQWSLFHEAPLSIWQFNRNEMVVEEDETDKRKFSERLYEKTVPENMKLAMRRFNHEAAIVAGDMDYRH